MAINYVKDFKGRKGGGGSSGGSATRTPDNLRSKDTVELVLGISEGPIEGLVEGAKSFKVGDTALQNQNGDYNFKAFELSFYPGLDNPDPIIPKLGGQGSNQAVNLALAKDIPVTRQTTTPNIDIIDIRLVFSRLMESTDSGTFTATVKYRIEYKKTSDIDWILFTGDDISLNGKTTSNYALEYVIPVERIAGTWDIRITKLSDDTNETYYSDMQWESYQEIVAGEMLFPHTACVHLVAEATDQFSSIPAWSGVYRGRIIQVPSNYNPIARTYSGAWDGTFDIAWTNNPAWCLHDFVTNDRYGIKSYYPEINLDRYDVYDAGKWCDELVPNGKGGLQPRYTFNCLIGEPRSGKELARYIAGTFNATFFDDLNGKAYLRVDKDGDYTFIFQPENIYQEGFSYSYTDITSRYNDITVTFKNPDLNWNEDRRRVYNQNLIDKYGRITLDFIAVGCTNEQEALRRAWYKLITATTETCIVNFQTNRLGGMISPFDIILISDPDMGYGITGRIKTVAEDRMSVNLREPVYLEVGVQYYITFTLNNGSKEKIALQTDMPGYNSVLYFTGELSEELPERATFAIEAEGYVGLPRPFRVTKIEEVDGNPDAIKIEAININRNKWYDADNITDSGVIQYSSLPNPFNPPGPVHVSFEERFIKNKRRFELLVSPEFNRGAYKYYTNDHSFEVWSRLSGTQDTFVKRELYLGDTIIDHPPGLYDFKILGKSYLGKTTDIDLAPIYIFNVTNPKDAPKDIDWIKINKREVYWGYQNPPLDFDGFIVRYHNQANRTTWDDAQQPHQGVLSATSFYTNLIPPSARVIMVRAVDVFGYTSNNSAIVYRDLGDISVNNEVDRVDYHPSFSGTKIGCAVDDDELKANDTSGEMYSGIPTAKIYNTEDGSGDMYEATYEEMSYIDEFTVTSPGSLVIEIDFDGVGYEINIKEQSETAWQPVADRQFLTPGDYDIKLRIFGGPVRGIVREFSAVIDADEILQESEDFEVSSAAAIRLPLTKNFGTIRRVSVIIQNSGGDTAVGYRVLDKNPTLGPEIELLDSAGDVTSGLIDYQIKGY